MSSVMVGLVAVGVLAVLGLGARYWRSADVRRWGRARDVMAGWAEDPWGESGRTGCNIMPTSDPAPPRPSDTPPNAPRLPGPRLPDEQPSVRRGNRPAR